MDVSRNDAVFRTAPGQQSSRPPEELQRIADHFNFGHKMTTGELLKDMTANIDSMGNEAARQNASSS